MHIQLPSPTSPSQVFKSSSRRSPLSPSTVIPPSISVQNSSATRHEAGSPTKASVLLSKVASSPGSRRRTPASTPLPTPPARESERQIDSLHMLHNEQHSSSDEGRWSIREKRDGYVSFPDFEQYQQSFDSQDYGDNEENYDQS
ncbi:hypothetical protein P152DRAFT_473214 [Eremomyces bilateralis CBS 781.70]|uniref:Uncharacterized protein n=1 Tax=Eremomyces bilateralis CBS 781.70 TaxID=1392243 RepID=A0A6G1G5Z8_9PEZI|nr:uncharacterized protein P152DRAFT_473214 [Eremomyces bilateralis CBS 781.70]KAF1813493.1 hypothetical protein P152DRAFT_473214 [Eremomyces bilateralis CBS 781.70]